MNLQAYKLSLIEKLLGVNDAQILLRVEDFLQAEISVAREKEIVPMTLKEYREEIELSLEDIREGRVISHDEVRKQTKQWR